MVHKGHVVVCLVMSTIASMHTEFHPPLNFFRYKKSRGNENEDQKKKKNERVNCQNYLRFKENAFNYSTSIPFFFSVSTGLDCLISI